MKSDQEVLDCDCIIPPHLPSRSSCSAKVGEGENTSTVTDCPLSSRHLAALCVSWDDCDPPFFLRFFHSRTTSFRWLWNSPDPKRICDISKFARNTEINSCGNASEHNHSRRFSRSAANASVLRARIGFSCSVRADRAHPRRRERPRDLLCAGTLICSVCAPC